jgi:hypothetical protein
MRFAPLALFVLFAAPVAPAKKPPLAINTPEVAKRYWEVRLRIARGKLAIVEAKPRVSRTGKTIHKMAGPFRIALVGHGEEMARYEFSFPLLGPGEHDRSIAEGMTAETKVLVPHREGLSALVAEGPGGTPRARRAVRWRP